jgi:hypothetical protein
VREPIGAQAFTEIPRLPFLPGHVLPLCASAGWVEVFQRAGDFGTSDDVAECRLVCRRCEFTSECRAYALDTGQVWGVWGGQRMQLAHHRKRVS